MKRTTRFLVGLGCLVLVAVSWLIAVTAKSDAKRQEELIEKATVHMQDEAYVRAVPLLEEAAEYEDKHTLEAEDLLKQSYLKLSETSGYTRKYKDLLDKQMARKNVQPDIFEEAARYYLDTSKASTAFEILRNGIDKTGSEELLTLYEDTRYAYKTGRSTYADVGAIYQGTIQVKNDGGWGIATADGTLVIPCEYDKISTFSDGQTIAKKGSVISAIDADNNRVALCHDDKHVKDFSNYANERIGLKTDNGWVLANGDFQMAEMAVDEIAMFSGSYLPAKQGEKWGMLSADGTEWETEPKFDDIIRDELGRCSAQNAVFVKKGGQVILYVDGDQVGDTYEAAKPFADGWAAVKKNGKWGYIDTEGTVKIDYQFDDALSFGQHLAAVKQGRYWGYISVYGKMVISPDFLEAKSFSDGSAPVKTADGWRFITLLEYEKEVGIL